MTDETYETAHKYVKERLGHMFDPILMAGDCGWTILLPDVDQHGRRKAQCLSYSGATLDESVYEALGDLEAIGRNYDAVPPGQSPWGTPDPEETG